MDNLFDKFFDDFFNERFNKISKMKMSEEERLNLMNILSSFKDITNIDENIEKNIDDSLGEPDKIERFKDGDLFFEKRIWKTSDGELVKLIVTDNQENMKTVITDEDLKEQQAQAIAVEDYMKAAAIRDELKRRSEEKAKSNETKKKIIN